MEPPQHSIVKDEAVDNNLDSGTSTTEVKTTEMVKSGPEVNEDIIDPKMNSGETSTTQGSPLSGADYHADPSLQIGESASSISSTRYEGDDQQQQNYPPSNTTSGAFENSAFFQFGQSNDFFSSNYGERGFDYHQSGENIRGQLPTSATNSGRIQSSFATNVSSGNNGQEIDESGNINSGTSTRPTQGNASYRKSSIEVFLSQSPSQSLGPHFFGMNLGNDTPTHRRNMSGGAQPPHFSLNPVPELSPRSVNRDPYNQTRTDDLWNSSNELGGTEYLSPSSHMDHAYPGYYRQQPSQQYAPSSSYGPSSHDSHLHPASDPYNSTCGYGYSSGGSSGLSRSRALGRQMSAHDGSGMNQLGEYYDPQYMEAFEAGARSAQASRSSPPHQQHQMFQHPYHNVHSQSNPRLTRSHSAYDHFSSSPDMSPPHSPRKLHSSQIHPSGSPVVWKACRYFLQGHCRNGSRCKFVHQHLPAPTMPTYSVPGYPMQPQVISSGHHVPSSNTNVGVIRHEEPLQFQPRHSRSGEIDHLIGRHQDSLGDSKLSASISSTGSPHEPPPSGPLSVDEIKNRVFAMSKDQNGCRLLQEQLEYAEERKEVADVIYIECLDHLCEMMLDPFGNYLFQKLLERVDSNQRLVIIRKVSSHLVAAALNLHGTRSVQKVVEICAKYPEVVETVVDDHGNPVQRTVRLPDIIVHALQDDAVRLCIDANGNHVIQRALLHMKPEYNQFVFDAVNQACTTVGTHRHGCCVLQRCLDAANASQKHAVIAQVEYNAMKLMQDPYGNYVVQYVLDSCTAEEAYRVMLKPLGHIFELSVQKFSSNVVEKCLEKAPERLRSKYVEEITSCNMLQKMLADQFANYVVQRALCVSKEEQCLLLVKAIRPHLVLMKNTNGGRRITARIAKRFPDLDLSLELGSNDERQMRGSLTNSQYVGVGGGYPTSGPRYNQVMQMSNSPHNQQQFPSYNTHGVQSNCGPQGQPDHEHRSYNYSGPSDQGPMTWSDLTG